MPEAPFSLNVLGPYHAKRDRVVQAPGRDKHHVKKRENPDTNMYKSKKG